MTPAGLQALAQALEEAADYAASYRPKAVADRLADAAAVLRSMATDEIATMIP